MSNFSCSDGSLGMCFHCFLAVFCPAAVSVLPHYGACSSDSPWYMACGSIGAEIKGLDAEFADVAI